METKRSLNQLKSYLPVNLTDVGSAFLRLCISLTVLVSVACTQNTVNQTNPPVSQANPNTRVSDPDDWTGGGTGDGGGGQGIQCGDKLMVRDVYEAKYNYGRDLLQDKFGASGTEEIDDSVAEFLADSMVKFYRIAAVGELAAYKEYWKKFSKEIVFVPGQAHLVPSKDANSALTLPNSCKLVQIAYWDETSGVNSGGTLYVDKEKWKSLDQFNKAALLAHEHFFWRARMAGYKNSDYVRFKVGQMMSVEGLPSAYKGWIPSKDPAVSKWLPENRRGFKWCTGHFKDRANQATLIQYQEDNGDQRFVLAEAKLREHELPPLRATALSLSVDRASNALMALMDSRIIEPAADELVTNQTVNQAGLDGSPIRVLLPLSLPTKDKMGTFSIINPYEGNTKMDRALKSQEQLIAAVNLKIQDLLQPGATSTNVVSEDALVEALSVLHLEIQEYIQAKSVPSSLPKWTAVLQKIEGSGLKLKDSGRQLLYNKLPITLYRIKLGSYTSSIVESVLGNRALVDAPKAGGMARITVGSDTEDFDLICRSWSETYELIKESEQLVKSKLQ